MILVDTSVLIAFLKGSTGNKTQRFRAVLERNVPFGINALIMQEILQGAGSEREFSLLREYLSSQKIYLPSDPVVFHLEAARIYCSCRRRGITAEHNRLSHCTNGDRAQSAAAPRR